MMQRWRGCGTLELARALAIGRSANHSFGNNRLHTLHTKDTREPAEESPRSGAASPPISTYDPETSSSPLPIRSFSASFSVSKPIETSLSPRLLGKRNSSSCLYRFADNNDLSSSLSNFIFSNLDPCNRAIFQWNRGKSIVSLVVLFYSAREKESRSERNQRSWRYRSRRTVDRFDRGPDSRSKGIANRRVPWSIG